ncbi:hypothetical protein [Janthinobacterium sp. AD80]|uniref:hypothetical protein n=1 Tax=Janthinobacterium sp. AD80 TaxID=1528773 RepID=UPI000C84AF25|nr:hypothetical protein [Janthinobacterium sp. AD80]
MAVLRAEARVVLRVVARGGDGGTPGGGTGGTPGGGTGGTPGGGTGGGKEQLNCGAPGQPACRISEEGMKSVDGDEGDSELSLIDYHNKNALDQIGSVVKEKLMYGDWFPTINTAVCTNPTVPNPFGASSYEVDICKYVEIFAKFITGVICFFAVIGSVQQVTSAAKA